ncbi:hypothetical protein BE17_49235 [Sorangium cellulosum]|uniref:Uncharacterized protein n=1 Tax=Sorangium cellulosum TaxID=56 RepID=A0A150ST51_SORCE|nr:hypothetical protein BE17_49235 [Sorangium cellulosum]
MRLARLGFVPVLGFLPLLGFGCSDPAPPTPRGAYSLNFADPGASCNTSGHSETLGEVTAASRTKVLTDGEEGATVDCVVSGSGTFSVSARARNSATATEIRVDIDSISPSATAEMPATGSISFSSARTGGETFVSDPEDPCRFWFVPESEQGIDAGKIWVVFECTSMLNEGYSCELRRGALAFDSCGT